MHAAIWAGLRFLLVGGQGATRRRLREHVAPRPEERVLDVCCGTGEFAGDLDAHVVGIDLDPDFIAAARRRHAGDARRSFQVMNALAMDFPDGHFDHAMFVNGLHHFSDEDAARLLREVRRVTRGRIVLVDADGTPRGLIRPILFRLDRGRHMRTPAALERVVGSALQVRRRDTWEVGLYREVLLECA